MGEAMMWAERFCLKSRAANVAMITVVLLLNVSSRAQTLPAAAPLTPEPLRPGWDQIDERLVFLTIRLSSVEASIAAVDKAVKATGYSKSLRAEDAEHARMGNELMDRKGGGPVPWQDFYGRTAKDFFFHPGTVVQAHSISGSLRETDIQAVHTDTPIAVDRPPQLAYIYRANSDNQKRAEAAIAELGGKIDQLLERRRQLESEQSALWSEIAFQAVASRDLASKPLYRFNLKSSQPDPAADHAAAAGVACDFVRTVNQLMDDAQKDVETDPGQVFHRFSVAISAARKTLNDRLTDQESIALALSDPQSKISKVTAAAKRLDDLARNMDESYRLAHDGDVAGDDQRKNTFRGLLQDSLLNAADTLLTADQCVLDLLKDWKLTPDVRSAATQPSVHLDLQASSNGPVTSAGSIHDTPSPAIISDTPASKPAATPTKDRFLGTWHEVGDHYNFTLNSNGTASNSDGNDGIWSVNDAGNVIEIEWKRDVGWVDRCMYERQKWVKYSYKGGLYKQVCPVMPPTALAAGGEANSVVAVNPKTNVDGTDHGPGSNMTVPRPASAFPSIGGLWREKPDHRDQPDHLVTVSQENGNWTAKCSYNYRGFGEIDWEITNGTIAADGKLQCNLHHTNAPANWEIWQFRNGSLSLDGKTISGSALFNDVEHPFVWTKVESANATPNAKHEFISFEQIVEAIPASVFHAEGANDRQQQAMNDALHASVQGQKARLSFEVGEVDGGDIRGFRLCSHGPKVKSLLMHLHCYFKGKSLGDSSQIHVADIIDIEGGITHCNYLVQDGQGNVWIVVENCKLVKKD
jgi:hypothetical protein